MLRENLKGRTQQIPIEIAITNQKTKEVEYFRDETKEIMIKAVLASSSIKGIFSAVKIDNKKYRDGGYTNNLPYINFQKEEYITIAVKTNIKNKKSKVSKKIYNKIVKYPDLNPDYLLDINHIQNISLFKLSKTEFIIKVGYRMAKQNLDIKKIKKELSQKI
jgi:NTE family protein